MIAKVRIAPVEQWCPETVEYAKRHPTSKIIVGVEVSILTETMEILDCEGRGPSKYWKLTPESDRHLDALTGEHNHGTKLCEHMLEMD